MNDSLDLLQLETLNTEKREQQETHPVSPAPISFEPVPPDRNPYQDSICPNDIFNYLLPDGSFFGLFSDPYATMKYIDVQLGNRNAQYWFEQRKAEHSFTDREIRLIQFLSEQRVATSKQIHRVVFSETPLDKPKNVRLFLKKSKQRGFICSFSWTTPLKNGQKKPLVYGLTEVGKQAAAEILFKQIPDDFYFHPIEFPNGKGPNMNTFFIDLVCNELYAELTRLDRLVKWERRPQIRLNDGTNFHPGASFITIKDRDELMTFWVEVVRPGYDWVNRTKSRFIQIQNAINKISPFQVPMRLIVITDGDARIPMVQTLASTFMPDLQVRYTTDERLVAGVGNQTFLQWNEDDLQLKAKPFRFLHEEHPGMTASEYLRIMESEDEYEDEDEDEY